MGHPDDEALSAHLDGEVTPWAPHLGACVECSGRLNTMAAVRNSLAVPVEISGEVRERVIAAALATYEETFAGSPTAQAADETPAPATISPIGPVGARRRPALVAVISVAAVLLTVMGAVGVLTRNGANDGGNQAATSPEAAKNRSAAGATSADSIHLGEISDRETLVMKVTGTGSSSPESSTGQSSSAGGSASAGASASNYGDTGDAISSARSAPSASPPALAAPGTIEDSAGSIANSGASSSAEALSGPVEGGGVSAAPWACEKEVRNSHAGAGEVVYRALASHLAAETLVFGLQVAPGTPEAPMPLTLVMVTRDGCQLVFEAVVP